MVGRRGFTLVEALVSMLLSTLIVILVTTTFLVQNEFYSDAAKRSALQENVRGAVSLVSTELRGVAAGGIAAAEADSVVYRVPLAIGGVCAVNGAETYLHLPLEGGGVVESEVAGYAVRDADGAWTHTASTWASIYHSNGVGPAQTCRTAGADTVGALADFYRLDNLVASPALQAGDLVMVYREMTFKLAPSVLDSSSTAVFWGQAGQDLTEFANSLGSESAFQYRLSNSSTFRDFVRGGGRERIVVVRFSALGTAPASRMNRDSLSYDLSVTVPLGNAY